MFLFFILKSEMFKIISVSYLCTIICPVESYRNTEELSEYDLWISVD